MAVCVIIETSSTVLEIMTALLIIALNMTNVYPGVILFIQRNQTTVTSLG